MGGGRTLRALGRGARAFRPGSVPSPGVLRHIAEACAWKAFATSPDSVRPATRGHASAEGYSQKPHPGKKAKGTGNRPGRIRQETAEPQAPGARSKKERAGVSTWRQGEGRAGAGPGPPHRGPQGLGLG